MSQSQSQVRLLLQEPFEFSAPADRCEAEICTSLAELIDSAEESVDFAIYGARNQTAILDALLAAESRGVRVRGVVDRGVDGENYYTSTDEWARRLSSVTSDQAREGPAEDDGDFQPECQRPRGFDGPLQCLAFDLGDRWLIAEHASRDDFTDPELGGVNQIMHNKFFIVDSQYVWTGSANLSDSGTGGYNANAVLLADSPELAQVYQAEFERLIDRQDPDDRKASDGIEELRLGDADIAVWFSPQDDAMRFGVQGLIARAESSIDVAVFYLTNKWVTAELIAAHRRGVRVRVLVDATSAKTGYTKHELLRVAGIPTKVENWGGKLHTKAAVIDERILIVGSMNWTRAGEDVNDENTLLIRSQRLASEFSAFFERLWASVPDEWAAPGARPDPESVQSGTSCHDGVDNDFDDLIDSADPGCTSQPPALQPLPPHRLVTTRPETHRAYRGNRCDASYPQWFVCLPAIPPDLDCNQIPYRDLVVRGADPHRLDRDGDGRGCTQPSVRRSR